MKNEAIKTLKQYFRNESNSIEFFGSDVGVNMFIDFLQNGKTIANDAPDMILLKDNMAIIVEHFEFDSSHANRKGSSNRIEEARIDRQIREKMAISNEYIHQDVINASCSYQDYVANVTKGFLHHYNQIENYKQNLINKKIITLDTIVKIMFLIEDVSPIGSIAFGNNNGKAQKLPVTLAQCPEFLDLVEQYNQIDYVLCCSYVCDSEYVWFIDCDQIPAYREKQCDYANMRFFNNPICIVEFRKIVSNEGD